MKNRYKLKESLAAFLFILPSLAGVTVFYVVPYVICAVKSMFTGGSFTGLANYKALFESRTFLLALRNTGVFILAAIPLLMAVSFAFSLFLNSFKGVSAFFRSSLLIPVVVPVASLVAVWQVMFDDYGAVNSLLHSLGLQEIGFFDSDFSMVMIILIYVWKYTGFCTLLFTAGLASVPRQLYESARLDGASRWKLVTRITVPMITPTIFFVLIMEIIYSFKIFREVFVLFGEYPSENVYFLQHFINNNYSNLNYSRLSAAAVVMSLFVIVMLLAFFFFERRKSRGMR